MCECSEELIMAIMSKAYFNVYINEGTTEETIPTGVWTKLQMPDYQIANVQNFDLDDVNRRFVIVKPGAYDSEFLFHSEADINNLLLDTAVFKNGSVLPQAQIRREFKGAAVISEGKISFNDEAEIGDYYEVFVYHEMGSDIKIRIDFASLKANRI